MIDVFNNISEFIFKALFDVQRIFLITIVFMIGFFGPIDIEYIFLFSILLISISYTISSMIFKTSNNNSDYRKILSIIGIVFSILLSLYLFPDKSINFKIISFFYFIIIWIKGIHIVINDDENTTYYTKFIISLVVIFFTIFTIGIINLKWFKVNLSNYFITYFITWLILMSRLNLSAAYSNNKKNTINKKKNTFKFNVLSMISIGILSFLSFVIKFDIKKLLNYFSKAVYSILYMLGVLLDKSMKYLIKHNIVKLENYENISKKISENEIIEDGLDNKFKTNQSLESTMEVFKWIIIIMILLVVIYYIYKITKKVFDDKNSIDENDETKDFVLTKEDILNKIKNPFNKLSKNISRLFSTEKNNIDNLPVIRKIYIEVVIKFTSTGYKFKRHFTPNEYLKEIENTKYNDTNFDKLTNYYNEVRYGNKKMSEEDVKNANTINEKIKKLEFEE